MSVKHNNVYGPSTNALPSKFTLISEARKLDITHAFAELFDNAFQYFPLYSETDCMEITVSLSEEQGSHLLIFEQNSGGVPHENHEHLFAAGLGGGGSGPGPSISTYGRGFGIALPCLGNWIYVFTKHQEEEPIIWQLGDAEEPDEADGGDPSHPKNWYYPENRVWTVPTVVSLDGNSPEDLCNQGTTKIEIRRLTNKSVDELTDPDKYSKLLIELKKIYCRLIKTQQARGEISITFENEFMHDKALQRVDITDYLPENSVFEGDFEKIKQGSSLSWYPEESYLSFNQIFTTQEQITGTTDFKQLRIDVLMITKTGGANTSKFMMWGNDRLFETDYLPKKLTDGSLDDGYKSLDKSRPMENRWFGFVHFHSEYSELIPWNGPRKWGMKEDTGNEVVKYVQEILAYLGSTFRSKGVYSFNMQGLGNPPSDEKISWGMKLFNGGDSL